MTLKFVENPELDPDQIAELRKSVGWDGRRNKLEKIIGCTYMTAACYDDDLLVGCVDVISDGVDDAFIRNLVVRPEYQGRGIGLKLLVIVNNRLKADCIKTVNVLFEPELASFYTRAGFRIVGGGLIDNETERS